MSRRRSLLLRLAAAFSARRRSVATGMLRLRRSFGNPVVPDPAGRAPVVAVSGAAAGCVAFVGFVMLAVPHSRLLGGMAGSQASAASRGRRVLRGPTG